MYNEYFGFKEAPFSIAPDPRYLYMTAQHRDALAHLVYGLNSEGGCILLTGEVGTGKTTICRCLLEQIPDQANVALVLNPKVNEIELLETICDELKISYPDSQNTVKTYTDRIYNFLIETNRNNEKTVVIIDEAQNLSSKVLEQLRLLTNLETNQRKLLQIIILGQPELLHILARPEMRQLAQRITARFHLQPLTRNDVKSYISHRLAVAGQNIQLFPDNSINLLFKYSNGIPRLINVICDRSLLGAYVENQHSVPPAIIKKAVREVFGELKNVEKNKQIKRWLLPLAASIAAVFITGLYYVSQTPDIDKPTVTTALTDPSSDTAQIEPVLKNENASEKDSLSSEILSQKLIAKEIQITEKSLEKTPDKLISTENTLAEITGESLQENIADSDKTNISTIDSDTSAIKNGDIDDILKNPDNDRTSAYQQLFTAWNQEFNPGNSITACKQANNFSLSCLFKQGNLNSLKTHNRPAILKLINKQGVSRYVTITVLRENTATIFANNTEYTIELDVLNRYWYGQFILLWKKPENYSAAISPGDNGHIVNWLSDQLSDPESSTSSVYDDSLKTKVKNFQAAHGLSADGIVGPVTIIYLNAQSGMNVPLLSHQS